MKNELAKMDLAWDYFFDKIGKANRKDGRPGMLSAKAVYLADILYSIDVYVLGIKCLA